MAVPVSVHQPAPDRSQATWPDSTPDLGLVGLAVAIVVPVMCPVLRFPHPMDGPAAQCPEVRFETRRP